MPIQRKVQEQNRVYLQLSPQINMAATRVNDTFENLK